jgi:hypothetical protein
MNVQICIKVDQERTHKLRSKYSRRRPTILTGYRGFRQPLQAHSEPVSQTRPRSILLHVIDQYTDQLRAGRQ